MDYTRIIRGCPLFDRPFLRVYAFEGSHDLANSSLRAYSILKVH